MKKALVLLVVVGALIFPSCEVKDTGFTRDYNIISVRARVNGISYQMPEIGNYRYARLQPLYEALVGFATEDFLSGMEFSGATLQYASTKYFSVIAWFESKKDRPRFEALASTATMDLEQNKLVYLNDLVDINDEFIDLFMEGNLAKHDRDPKVVAEFGGDLSNLYSSEYTGEMIRKRFDLCSEPMTTENYAFHEMHSWKPSAYLSPGRIYFNDFERHVILFYIELADIEKFLKVDPW